MEMEGVVANAPSDCALLASSGSLVCLTLDAKIHNMVAADGTVVDDNVPSPEGDGVPLLDLKPLLCLDFRTLLLANRRCISHVDVGHDGQRSNGEVRRVVSRDVLLRVASSEAKEWHGFVKSGLQTPLVFK